MEHGSAHVGQLPKFPVSDHVNFLGPFNDPWIRHKETGYVRPVLIQIRVDRLRHNRTCDIRTAPGKCLDLSVRHGPIEAWDHRPFRLCQACGKNFLGLLSVKISLVVKQDHFCRVDKFIAQIFSHDPSV